MLKPGDRAPEIELPDQSGTVVRVSDLLATGPVVLFFYPAAMTPGCTAESCHFRDMGTAFAGFGAHRVGISADGVEKQKQFATQHEFDYPLLSDSERTVAQAFGVTRKIGITLPNKRVTFVIGQDGVIVDVIKSELKMQTHADDALATLAKIKS